MKPTELNFSSFLLAGTALKYSSPYEPSEERPNVLSIVVDDLNDSIGPYGCHPQTSIRKV